MKDLDHKVVDCNEMNCKSYANEHPIDPTMDWIWRSNNSVIPNGEEIWKGKIPIEIMDRKALIAYSKLLEDLLVIYYPRKESPRYY